MDFHTPPRLYNLEPIIKSEIKPSGEKKKNNIYNLTKVSFTHHYTTYKLQFQNFPILICIDVSIKTYQIVCIRQASKWGLDIIWPLTLFLPAMGGISPYMSVMWPSLVRIGLNQYFNLRNQRNRLKQVLIYFKWENFGSVISESLCTEQRNLL